MNARTRNARAINRTRDATTRLSSPFRRSGAISARSASVKPVPASSAVTPMEPRTTPHESISASAKRTLRDIALLAQQPLHRRDKLLRGKGLGHIRVRADRNPLGHVDFASSCREHDDLDVAPGGVFANALAQIVTAHPRHHDVEKNQVRIELADRVQSILAGVRNPHEVTQ